MIFYRYILLSISILLMPLFANDLEIDDLLDTIAVKTDLSEKTKLANGGVSYIFTRSDLERMQAHTLKDVLKGSYPFGYNENYFGLPDPFGMQPGIPNKSSMIKIYINNQEITTGLYGSGMVVYGDMDIDFVDHIEIYSGNPTFEYSTEPSFTIIKLYTKVAQKDEGSKVFVAGGSRGSYSTYGYNTQELDNGWSYFAYASYLNNDREDYENYDATLSKDKKQTHLLGTFYTKNHHFLIDAVTSKSDAFASQSIFLTPETSTIDNDFLHMGYDGKFGDLNVLLECDLHNTTTEFYDKNAPLIQGINLQQNSNIIYMAQTKSESQTYTAGLKYTLHTNNNTLLSGVKYRVKHYEYDRLIFNDHPLAKKGNTQQDTFSVFLENQYALKQNQIITLGATYSKVTNNNSVQDDDLYGVRAGYTYTNPALTSKSVFSHLELSIDPYLVNSFYLEDPNKKMPKVKYDIFMQNFIYKKAQHRYEVVGSLIFAKNQLYIKNTGKLASSDTMQIENILFRYKYNYRKTDNLEITFGYNYIDDVPQINDNLNQQNLTFRGLNSYKNFDIFNQLLFYRDSYVKDIFVDYSAGVKYHFNDDLSIVLKGINIFDDAKETAYVRLNPTTMQFDQPLQISPIDRSFMASLEYIF